MKDGKKKSEKERLKTEGKKKNEERNETKENEVK